LKLRRAHDGDRDIRARRDPWHVGGTDVFAPPAVATGERVQRDGYAYCDLVMES
jgi:hypothetical protein